MLPKKAQTPTQTKNHEYKRFSLRYSKNLPKLTILSAWALVSGNFVLFELWMYKSTQNEAKDLKNHQGPFCSSGKSLWVQYNRHKFESTFFQTNLKSCASCVSLIKRFVGTVFGVLKTVPFQLHFDYFDSFVTHLLWIFPQREKNDKISRISRYFGVYC